MRAMNMQTDPQLESLRLPPHSIEAEQSVLGGLLLDNSAWDRIADFLRDTDFYRFDHRGERLFALFNDLSVPQSVQPALPAGDAAHAALPPLDSPLHHRRRAGRLGGAVLRLHIRAEKLSGLRAPDRNLPDRDPAHRPGGNVRRLCRPTDRLPLLSQ